MRATPRAIVTMLVTLCLLAVFLLYVQPLETPKNSLETYHEARDYFHIGDFENAKKKFAEAQKLAATPYQEWQPAFRIATIPYHEGNPIESIALLKDVARKSTYPLVTARAIEYLGIMYQNLLDNAVYASIFEDQPYASLAVPNDRDASLKNLYEYASKTYPTSYSQIQIALWHSEQLMGAREDPELTQKIIGNIKALVEASDTDFNDIYSRNPENGTLSTILYLKGKVLGNIVRSGNIPWDDPELLFKKALILDRDASGGTREIPSFHYALFLAEVYGEERVMDIRKLLQIFYTKNSNRTRGIKPLIRFHAQYGYRGVQEGLYSAHEHDSLLLLMSLDPEFKSFIEELGYTLES